MIVEQELVENTLSNGEDSATGSTCRFIDLQNGWGIKCYDKEDYNNYATSFTVQKYMADKGCAPQVGESFQIGEYFCFVTEVVEPLTPYGFENDNSIDMDYDDDEENADIISDMENACDCFEKSNEWGLDYLDSHSANFGHTTDGKTVIIDFDTCERLRDNIVKEHGNPEGLILVDEIVAADFEIDSF